VVGVGEAAVLVAHGMGTLLLADDIMRFALIDAPMDRLEIVNRSLITGRIAVSFWLHR
jgi:hypothetical protein